MPHFIDRRGAGSLLLFGQVLVGFAACFLSACGGGGAEASTPATTPTDPTDPVEPVDPPVDPAPPGGFNPALDPLLAQLSRQGNAAPLRAAPIEDSDLVRLGQALFFDRELSGNRDISCYTCHDVDFASGDGLSVSIGTGGFGKGADRRLEAGFLIPRNAPALFHLAGRNTLFLDGRVSRRPDGTLVTPEPALNGSNPAAAAIVAQLPTALAAQAMFPVTNREEMRGQPGENEIADAPDNLTVWSLLMKRLVGTSDGPEAGIAGYRDLFARAYPAVDDWDDFNFGHAARALAAFEVASFDTSSSAFDRWLVGDASALSDTEKQGGILFYGRAGCARCHGGPALSDDRHHAIGIPQVGPGKDFAFEDTGRALVTLDSDDVYRFRTPSLRNTALTGPYTHDGAFTSLERVVRHYIAPEASLRNYDVSQLTPLLQPLVDIDPFRLDARTAAIDRGVRGGLRLDDAEVDQLVAFLRALTDADAADIDRAEPETVPSGLPIDDED